MKQFRTFTEGMQDETRARLIHNQLLRVLRTFNRHWRKLDGAERSYQIAASVEDDALTLIIVGPPPGSVPFTIAKASHMMERRFDSVLAGTAPPDVFWSSHNNFNVSSYLRLNGVWSVQSTSEFTLLDYPMTRVNLDVEWANATGQDWVKR